jgi:hypothetical protein
LRFVTTAPGPVTVDLLDLAGRRVRVLDESERPAGSHLLEFRRGNLRSGLYFVRLRSAGESTTGKLVLTP